MSELLSDQVVAEITSRIRLADMMCVRAEVVHAGWPEHNDGEPNRESVRLRGFASETSAQAWGDLGAAFRWIGRQEDAAKDVTFDC